MGTSRFSENAGEASKSLGRLIGLAVVVILGLIVLFKCIGYNTGGYRTVIESRVSGSIDVKFTNGFYFTLFGKTTEYPDIISTSFTEDETTSTVDIAPISIRFNDATSANATGVVKFMLPKNDSLMVKLHKDYRNVENLATTGFKPFVMECLKNSSQLMSSEMHYLGGRSTMSQYFQDQLEDGVYILETEEKVVRDTLENENKRVYLTKIIQKNSQPLRKRSMLTQYGIGITDAVIADVDYEERVDELLKQKIDATSETSISKQKLMKAQQEALTKEAEGKKSLVETEYKELQNQKTLVIQAETQVKLKEQEVRLQEQEKLKEKAAYEASLYAAKKTKELAEAEAYAKKAVMNADGALEVKLKALVEINKNYADAIGKQPLVPSIMFGGSANGGHTPASTDLINMLMIKTAKDLSVDVGTKKGGN